MRAPRMTLTLAMLNIVAYHHFAHSFLFSPVDRVVASFGLVPQLPLSIITYQFVHLWPSHLFTNVFLLLVFGFILERRLGPFKMLGVYAVGGVAGALVHLSLSPGIIISGASASVWALVGATLVLEPVRSLVSFLVSSLFVLPLLLNPSVALLRQNVESATAVSLAEVSAERDEVLDLALARHEELSELSVSASATSGELDEKQRELDELEKSLQSGELSEDEYTEAVSDTQEELLNARSELEAIRVEMTRTQAELETVKKVLEEKTELSVALESDLNSMRISTEIEARTMTADSSHLAGLLSGYLMMILLEPTAFEKWKRYFTHL